MDELSAVSVPDMAELRVSGTAVPLLPEYDIGPMLYDGRWWYVAAAGPADAYVPTPPELVGELQRMKSELDALEALVIEQAGTKVR